jgi:hypothetical protein
MDDLDAAIALSTSQSLHHQDADSDDVLVNTQSLESSIAPESSLSQTSFVQRRRQRPARDERLWSYARLVEPHEKKRDHHGHERYYCGQVKNNKLCE